MSTGFGHNIKTHSLHQVTGLLDVQFVERAGVTILLRQKQQTPLKVTKTHRLPDGRLGITLMDCSPGMLSGDKYRIAFQLASGCRVFANNQSFTRVHPSRPHEYSSLTQRLVLESGAFLEYAMEPTMLFRDAHLHANTEVELEAGATLIFHDVLCPGRTSRGELFQYQRYSGKMSVRWAGELIYANHLCVDLESIGTQHRPDMPNESNAPHLLHSLCLWGEYTHLGNLLVFAESVNEQWVEWLRNQLRQMLFYHCEFSTYQK